MYLCRQSCTGNATAEKFDFFHRLFSFFKEKNEVFPHKTNHWMWKKWSSREPDVNILTFYSENVLYSRRYPLSGHVEMKWRYFCQFCFATPNPGYSQNNKRLKGDSSPKIISFPRFQTRYDLLTFLTLLFSYFLIWGDVRLDLPEHCNLWKIVRV